MLSRTSTHGRPGTSARKLARRRTAAAFAVFGLAAVLAATMMASGLPIPGLIALGCGWLAYRTLRASSGRAVAGADGESLAGEHLGRLRAAAVVYNARLPGRRGDVDVVVLGPMAAAVEVKRGSGRVRWHDDGRVWAGGRSLPGRPLRQAVAQAAATRRAIGLDDGHVDAVLCVTDMRQRPRLASTDGNLVWITSARHLRRVLRRLSSQLASGEARKMAASIA